jgi:hypothetical protein
MNDARVFTLIKEAFPSIDWNKLSDADRSLNWELWNGPLPSDYWTECEPLVYYEWSGWEKACEDIADILQDLPSHIYYSEDADCIDISNPDDNPENWTKYEDSDEYFWSGFDYWKLNPRKYVLHEESYKQVY